MWTRLPEDVASYILQLNVGECGETLVRLRAVQRKYADMYAWMAYARHPCLETRFACMTRACAALAKTQPRRVVVFSYMFNVVYATGRVVRWAQDRSRHGESAAGPSGVIYNAIVREYFNALQLCGDAGEKEAFTVFVHRVFRPLDQLFFTGTAAQQYAAVLACPEQVLQPLCKSTGVGERLCFPRISLICRPCPPGRATRAVQHRV